ncbi:hypothetical protein B296_00036488, partial [Ensete ventricosum]
MGRFSQPPQICGAGKKKKKKKKEKKKKRYIAISRAHRMPLDSTIVQAMIPFAAISVSSALPAASVSDPNAPPKGQTPTPSRRVNTTLTPFSLPHRPGCLRSPAVVCFCAHCVVQNKGWVGGTGGANSLCASSWVGRSPSDGWGRWDLDHRFRWGLASIWGSYLEEESLGSSCAINSATWVAFVLSCFPPCGLAVFFSARLCMENYGLSTDTCTARCHAEGNYLPASNRIIFPPIPISCPIPPTRPLPSPSHSSPHWFRSAPLMEPDASALLLDALQSCDYRGLYDRFASFLLPFGDFVPLHSHNLNPPATKKGATATTSYSVSATAAPKKRGLPKKKKKLEPDPAALRPLAKQFLPFLCRALKHLPALLRKSPKSTNADVDDGRTVELLAVYRLLLDCLACIGPCLAGKPYSVHLQRGRLVVCLEACGRYAEAEEEALALLESLGAILVEAASMPKSRKIKIAGGGCFLPDPAQVNADDPEITMLVIEVITVLSGCAYKSKIRKEVAYERILTLIDQVQPWL